MGAAAFVVLCVLALRDAKRQGLDHDAVVDTIFWTSVAAIVGARGLYVWQALDQMTSVWDAVNLRKGGMVFYGAFLGLPVGMAVAVRRGLPLLLTADLFARILPLAHAVSRVGCFLAGCCHGRPTDVPWAVTFTDPKSIGPLDVAMHPTQLYEATGLVALHAALTVFAPRKRFQGQVLLLYVGGYALLRGALIEPFRGDVERGFVLEPWLGQTVSTSQGIAIAMLIGVAVAWRVLAARSTPTTPSPDDGSAPGADPSA